jgi:uncharacterized protein DUF4440
MITADELRALELRRLGSLREADMALARDLHADNYQLITPHGQTINKDDYLSGIASGAIDYHVFEPASQIEVRVSPSMAVVRYRARIDIQTPGGREQLTCWHTDMYEFDGHWQAVWSQATPIAD